MKYLTGLSVITLGLSGTAFAIESGGEIFLQGDFVEVGVHSAGSFGSSTPAPAGFHNINRSQLSFVVDPGRDGFGVGSPAQSGDFSLPGSPEEGWVIEWGLSGSEQQVLQFGRQGLQTVSPSRFEETSSGDISSAIWEGVVVRGDDTLRIAKIMTIGKHDQYIHIDVDLTNAGDTTLPSLEYMRNIDPDQDFDIGGSHATNNYVLASGRAAVAEGASSGIPLVLGSEDGRAVASTEGFSNRDPDLILDSAVQPSRDAPQFADQAIALAFRLGDLKPGESVQFSYVYVLDHSATEEALSKTTPIPRLSAQASVGSEAVGSLDFVVSLSRPSDELVSVAYATVPNSAEEDEDYAPLLGELSFSPGETTKTVAVSVINDALFEADDEFFFDLFDASDNVILMDSGARVTGTILNDDAAPVVGITLSRDQIYEDPDRRRTSSVITASLSEVAGIDIPIEFVLSGDAEFGVDYSLPSLVVPAGELSASVELTAIEDGINEPVESAVLSYDGTDYSVAIVSKRTRSGRSR